MVNISSLTIDEINESDEDNDLNLVFDKNENLRVKNEANNNSNLNLLELSFIPLIAIILVIFVLCKILFRRFKLKNKRANYKK